MRKGLEKSEEPNDSNVTKKFKDRLTRYYKFFEYRKQKLAAMRQPENKSTKAYKEELKEIIYGKELLKGNNKILEKIQTKKRLSKKESKTVLECFVKSYSADIWTAAVGMYQIFADKHEIIKLSIKFDKILLRLADLLDMSSYRVSKPILYHNVEQMSEESAFHWISHLLTKGYSLRTEYEITDNAHVLAPKNIIEKLVLEIPVNISQMSALTCGRTCKKVGIDRNRLSQQGIVLVCGQECKDNGNQERNCNFLCKWFCVKNENLIKELAALKEYLNRNKNNYFKSAIEIRIKCNDRTSLDARQFEILNEYIGKM